MNQVKLVGDLIDLEVIDTEEGKKAKAKVLIERVDKTTFEVDVIGAGKVAEQMQKRLKRSSYVGIKGKLEKFKGKLVVELENIVFINQR